MSHGIKYVEFLQPEIHDGEGRVHVWEKMPAGYSEDHRSVLIMLF